MSDDMKAQGTTADQRDHFGIFSDLQVASDDVETWRRRIAAWKNFRATWLETGVRPLECLGTVQLVAADFQPAGLTSIIRDAKKGDALFLGMESFLDKKFGPEAGKKSYVVGKGKLPSLTEEQQEKKHEHEMKLIKEIEADPKTVRITPFTLLSGKCIRGYGEPDLILHEKGIVYPEPLLEGMDDREMFVIPVNEITEISVFPGRKEKKLRGHMVLDTHHSGLCSCLEADNRPDVWAFVAFMPMDDLMPKLLFTLGHLSVKHNDGVERPLLRLICEAEADRIRREKFTECADFLDEIMITTLLSALRVDF